MGYNTTVVVMNDALDQIEKDAKFGEKIAQAIYELSVRQKPIDVSAGNHCNAATVIESHHADSTVIVTVGGNYGTKQCSSWGYTHHTRDSAEKHLRAWADQLGFVLHKKIKLKAPQ